VHFIPITQYQYCLPSDFLSQLMTRLVSTLHRFLPFPVLLEHSKKRWVNLSGSKLWSPQLHLSGHVHVVIKERAHKCNPYFDPIQISKREVQLDQDSQFQATRRGRNAKIACSYISACTCSIIASPSYGN